MSESEFDLIIIGAGSAGYNGAASAAKLGLKVALVDGAAELAGLCILRGCMPSKALLAASNRFHAVRHSAEFGITVRDAQIDLAQVIARKQKLVAGFARDRREQIETGPFQFFHAQAAFVDPQTVELTSAHGQKSRIRGAYFLLATGSRVKIVDLPGLGEIGCFHSDEALEMTRIPKSLIVLGAGAVGLEFATYFSELGTQVTILQRGEHILKGSDHDVADTLQAALQKRGITVHTGVKLFSTEQTAHGKTVRFHCGGKDCELVADEILQALGRSPNLDRLGLAEAGLEVEGECLQTEPTQQTGQPHIFAAGDVCGPYEIVHLAIQQAEVAVRNVHALREGRPLEKIDYRLKLFVLFTQPEVAQVGITESEANEAGEDFLVAKYPFDDHGKSLVLGETEGFVKLIARRQTGEILGGAVVGPEASSLIHEITAVMHFQGAVQELARMPHYHPTLSEIWTYPAEELAGKIAQP